MKVLWWLYWDNGLLEADWFCGCVCMICVDNGLLQADWLCGCV